jgi:hypothetical protein
MTRPLHVWYPWCHAEASIIVMASQRDGTVANGAEADSSRMRSVRSVFGPQLNPDQRRRAMPFLHMLPDVGMNYTFNRPLLDGTSPARLKELSAIAPRIKDYDSWYTVWLEVAKKAEVEKRWLDAASYYHGAEFYLPAGDVRNGLYDDFARTWALGMKDVAGYERIAIPYPAEICRVSDFRQRAKNAARSSSPADTIRSSKSSTTFFSP